MQIENPKHMIRYLFIYLIFYDLSFGIHHHATLMVNSPSSRCGGNHAFVMLGKPSHDEMYFPSLAKVWSNSSRSLPEAFAMFASYVLIIVSAPIPL